MADLPEEPIRQMREANLDYLHSSLARSQGRQSCPNHPHKPIVSPFRVLSVECLEMYGLNKFQPDLSLPFLYPTIT
jgi:hypothetical protein